MRRGGIGREIGHGLLLLAGVIGLALLAGLAH
jgi:hypothetical protein